MKVWLPRLAVLLILALVLGVPFLLRPAAEASREAAVLPVSGAAAARLVVLTPHNEAIRFEFARAFNAWRAAQGRPSVEFDWRSSGGTTDLRRQVESELRRAAFAGREDAGMGYDLFWGGGDIEHNGLARGITIQRDGQSVTLPATVPVTLPADLLDEAFPQPDIGGVPLYHPEQRWVGVVLSSFGIVYNRDVLGMIGEPEPQTWSNLASPHYLRWVALADPGHSGSIAATYNVILRRHGWTEGWDTLRRIFANARYFTASAGKVPVDVAQGEAAAGMCIDFYGRFQAGAVGDQRVGYVDPRHMTAITPDPISIVRGAPNKPLADEFVAWLLSRDAQALWQRRLGTPGGPARFELRRLPIRRDLYTPEEMAGWADPVNPFALARPLAPGMPDFFRAVAPISQAMAIDVHDDLQKAWRALLEHPHHRRRAEMEQLFYAMPPELTLAWPDHDLERHWRAALEDADHPRHAEAAGHLKAFIDGLGERYGGWRNDTLLEDRLAWSRFFRDNYRQVVRISDL